MEEEEDGADLTPFWVQSATNRSPVRRLRRGVSSFFLSSGLLISILLITAVSFLLFVVPSTLSFSSQIFRPNSVKKSWDSLNLVLVLLALVFGFLSRNKNDDRSSDEYSYQTTTPSSTINETQKSNPSGYSSIGAEKSNPTNHLQWFGGYSDQTADDNTANYSKGGLRRTSCSYPDLLEASSTLTVGDDIDPWVSYDDTRIINTSQFSDTGKLHRRRSWKYSFDDPFQFETHKNAILDSPKQPPSLTPAVPPSPPAPPTASPQMDDKMPKRAHQSVGHKRERSKRRDSQMEYKKPVSEPTRITTHPPPPPPPPPPLPAYVDQRSGKSDKKRSGGSARKDFLNSLYHKKKKKQRQKSVENFDALLHEPKIPPIHFQIPPPSPPPPPPPPAPPTPAPSTVFQILFSSKKSKRRPTDTIISVPIPPPERIAAAATRGPPQPVKVRSFDSEEGNSNSGGESPLIPIPPPPPPPPPFLKSPAWKFVLQGDFVRLDSTLSSRSGSPEPEEVVSDESSTAAADGGDTTMMMHPSSPLFCPSPDVNTKAESFISRFRAGLKLEKINSMNKRVGLSNLRPEGSGPSQN